MASPFKHFRKHQKVMLAVVGILCMIGFTIGGASLDLLGMGGSPEDPVIATANGEKIRQSELAQLRRAKYLANHFVMGSAQLAFQNDYFLARLQYMQQRGVDLEQYFGPNSDESLMQTRLLADRADQLGMVVSDDAVNEFLRSLTQDKVPREGFKSLVKELNATQDQIFTALRTELAAQRLREMTVPNALATPAQRWDYYRRMKQRAVVEVAAVSVAEFTESVPEPAADELAKFFDVHKEQEPQPLSPTPGFKIPKQAAFQFFVAEYDKFYDEASVTQDEIEKHYEANKDQKYLFSAFDIPEPSPLGTKQPAPGEIPAPGESPTDEKPAAKPGEEPDEKPSAPAAKPGEEPAAEEKPAPAEKAPAEEKPEEKTQDGGEAADDKAADDKQSSAAAAGANLAAAALSGRSSLHVAGLLESLLLADEAKAPGAGDKTDSPQDEPDASPGKADDTPAAETTPPDKTDEVAKSQPAGESPEQSAADAEPKSAAGAKKGSAGPAPPISDDLLLNRDVRSGEKPKHAPLWKVEALIRKELAGQKAVERMNKAFGVIQAKMSRFSRNLDPDETHPKPPDLRAAAEAQQLIERTTELQTAQAFEDDFPALADATPDQQSFAQQPQKLIDIGYGTMAPFRSLIVKDLAGNRYLLWKIDEKDAYVPELAEVRDEVVASWKQIEARDLARKRAEELVDKAKASEKPLSETLGAADGVSVTTTPSFSWLTRGASAGMFDSQTPPKLSEVEGVQHAGSAFMREVFSLGVGEVGAAMNEPQTLCYVVRVVSLEPSREVLRDLFISEPYNLYASASYDDLRAMYDAWIKGIEREAHLQWIQPPDKPQGPSESE